MAVLTAAATKQRPWQPHTRLVQGGPPPAPPPAPAPTAAQQLYAMRTIIPNCRLSTCTRCLAARALPRLPTPRNCLQAEIHLVDCASSAAAPTAARSPRQAACVLPAEHAGLITMMVAATVLFLQAMAAVVVAAVVRVGGGRARSHRVCWAPCLRDAQATAMTMMMGVVTAFCTVVVQ